ncbi:MAG: lysozyme inhibitor LprI family protein [Elusimicrobiales bacterium]|nr:lysozyme inhibitor LprI family protein [Elusimicrobiales bacterium]
MKKTILAAAACVLLAAGAKAAPSLRDTADEAYKICMKNAQSNPQMIECATEAEGNWDKAINETFQKLMKVLNPQGQNSLERQQQSWLAHRSEAFDAMDAACSKPETGSECKVEAAISKAKFVRARALALEKMLNRATGQTSKSASGTPASQEKGDFCWQYHRSEEFCNAHNECAWDSSYGCVSGTIQPAGAPALETRNNKGQCPQEYYCSGSTPNECLYNAGCHWGSGRCYGTYCPW